MLFSAKVNALLISIKYTTLHLKSQYSKIFTLQNHQLKFFSKLLITL